MRTIDADALSIQVMDASYYDNQDEDVVWNLVQDAPTIDAVPIADVEAWLLEIAFNNTDSEYGNEAMASSAEDLAKRMEGLRKFSEDRRKTNAG